MAGTPTAELLDNVQAAIVAVLNNQSYTLDGRSVTRANLEKLTMREEILIARINREAPSKNPRVAQANMSGYKSYNTSWDCD